MSDNKEKVDARTTIILEHSDEYDVVLGDWLNRFIGETKWFNAVENAESVTIETIVSDGRTIDWTAENKDDML